MFVGGHALIRSHNTWIIHWSLLITLIGWMSLALGLYRMFYPKGKQLERNYFTYVSLATLLLVGFFLTVKAYF